MGGRKIIPFKRKREGRTNYKKRLTLLKSKKLRLVIRKTNKQILIQIVKYYADGDKIICGINSSSLKKQGWKYSCNNLPACYLAGLMLGKKALDSKVNEAILDVGLQTSIAGSRLYASVKGVIDAGLKVPVSEKIFPSDERLCGKHIADYKKEKSQITKDFEDLKNKLIR